MRSLCVSFYRLIWQRTSSITLATVKQHLLLAVISSLIGGVMVLFVRATNVPGISIADSVGKQWTQKKAGLLMDTRL
ncbi:hypothetical protein [Pseudomonas sp. A-RE-19]|uniref:hypothetical protein n=1 Tax=Pseudomonas sp. A-RE-19 TaxID=2832401 RepID=UPI001CBB24ED|nr:hypothetical protein [Pseudomonas sp. A-RE-19]